jgi:hypothetical protein
VRASAAFRGVKYPRMGEGAQAVRWESEVKAYGVRCQRSCLNMVAVLFTSTDGVR